MRHPKNDYPADDVQPSPHFYGFYYNRTFNRHISNCKFVTTDLDGSVLASGEAVLQGSLIMDQGTEAIESIPMKTGHKI